VIAAALAALMVVVGPTDVDRVDHLTHREVARELRQLIHQADRITAMVEVTRHRRACPQDVTGGTRGRERYINCEVERIWPGHRALVMATAHCEVGDDLIDNGDPASEYDGPFQHDDDLFVGRYRQWGRGHNHPRDGHLVPVAAHFRSNVIVTLRFARALGHMGDPHWPNCP
jgi:hypothetical protein